MARQHSSPVLLDTARNQTTPLDASTFLSEAELQNLIHDFPSVLPIAEIDRSFLGAIPICRELSTPAGPIDNLMVTASGLPVLVECKLWRNPQARREVVGQALDYAKELSKWTSADIDREVRRKNHGTLFDLVREQAPECEEADFHDALSRNLETGRCLLLIVGDGIREGVEAIFEHLRAQAILHFSFGLVELPVFTLPSGDRIVTPRIVARTSVDVRSVIEIPRGARFEQISEEARSDSDPETAALGDDRQQFWTEFLELLSLDDPEQPLPRAPRQGYIALTLPAPQSSAWITVFRDVNRGEVGLFLSSTRDSKGQQAVDVIVNDWEYFAERIGGNAGVVEMRGKQVIAERRAFGDLSDPRIREQAFKWLSERANTFVNTFRPAVRSAISDLGDD